MSDFFSTRERLRKIYSVPTAPRTKVAPRGEELGANGFLTEVAGRLILTAPASRLTLDELPKELATRWTEMASTNPHVLWLQGRFVEAEKANRNGAMWTTADLEFGEMTVRHGPLNWLHDEKTVVGTIADNALIHPGKAELEAAQKAAYHPNYATTSTEITLANSVFDHVMPRPYIAAASAVWRWVHPDKVREIEHAAGDGKLYYSMECIAREMACVSDDTHTGCGQSFDYVTAMTQPDKVCEHIAGRTSARRLVDPSFLGGACIVPPTQPGWGMANVEIMRQAASLAEQIAKVGNLADGEWEALMGQVVRFATT